MDASAQSLKAGSLVDRSSTYKTFKDSEPRFTGTGFKDVVWAILFWAHLIGVIYVLGYRMESIVKSKHEVQELKLDVETGYFPVLLMSCGGALLFAMIWMVMLRTCIRCIRWVAIGFGLMTMLGPCIAAYVAKNFVLAGFWGTCFVLKCFYIYWVWDKIELTIQLVQVTTGVSRKYPGMILVTIAALIPAALTLLTYLVGLAIVKHDLDDKDGWQGEGKLIIVALCFSFFWTWSVIGNVVHTTICGIMARWYFVPAQTSASIPALKQSLTTSFGPIALGSLIMAIVRTIKLLTRVMRQVGQESDNLVISLLACCLMCIVSCLESALEFLSTYAYVHVAAYGCSFCEGAHQTWQLFKEAGLEMIVNYDFSASISFSGSMAGAVVNSLLTWALVRYGGDYVLPDGHTEVYDGNLVWLYVAFAALVGYGAVMVTMTAIESGACSLLVCYGEHPAVMQQQHPELVITMGKVLECTKGKTEDDEEVQ